MKFEDIKATLFFRILLTLVFFDSIYITLFSNFFNTLFKNVQGGRSLSIKYGGFIVTYLFMSSVIYYFGFVKKFTLSEMFILGISIYGVYELTNYTTLIEWDKTMVIIDTLWGGILFTISAYVTKKLN